MGAVCVVALLALAGCSRQEINLSDYVKVEFDGYEGYGKAEVEFDYKQIFKDFEKSFKDDSVARKKFKKAELELSKDSKLKNGDEVTVEWKDIDTAGIEEEYRVALSCEDVEVKVSGLKALEEFDPFEGIELRYEDYSGAGSVYLNWDTINSYDFSYEIVDQNNINGTLTNGDKVTVKASSYYYTEEEMLESFAQSGRKPSRLECEYTVAGLENPVDYDPSSAFYIEYSGLSPKANATVRYNYDDPYCYYWSFVLDKSEDLALGDTIKVTMDYSWYDSLEELKKSYLRNYGLNITATEWTFTVDSLNEYFSSVEMLTEEDAEAIVTVALNALTSSIEDWNPDNTLKDIQYIGDYIYTDYSWSDGDYSVLYLLFHATADTPTDKNVPIYWYISYDKLVKSADGTINFDPESGKTPNDNFSGGWWMSGEYFYTPSGDSYFVGFDSLESLYNSKISYYQDSIIEELVEDVDYVPSDDELPGDELPDGEPLDDVNAGGDADEEEDDTVIAD